ncbi:MAG: N-acetyltransferase [Alphaproteobacteria bacterium]|nr:N-acetyltransferase [Alphaproteobacteria bacterium]
MPEDFLDNSDKNRFEYHVEEEIVFADYRKKGDHFFITHVEAPQKLRGSGAAGKLMRQIMDKARQDHLKITPLCGYAVAWISRHKEYDDIVE